MKLIFRLIIASVIFFSFFLFPIFGGAHFCFPGFEKSDNGPGSVGCFYSSK